MNYIKSILITLCLLSLPCLVEGKISQSSAVHIQQRHWHNAKSDPKASRFNRSMSMQKLDALSQKTIKNGSVRKSTHGQNRLTHQYHFNKPIGVGSNGKKAYSLRVVTDKKNNVITAFPVSK